MILFRAKVTGILYSLWIGGKSCNNNAGEVLSRIRIWDFPGDKDSTEMVAGGAIYLFRYEIIKAPKECKINIQWLKYRNQFRISRGA